MESYQNLDITHHLRHACKFIMPYFTRTLYGCNIWGLASEEIFNKIEVSSEEVS